MAGRVAGKVAFVTGAARGQGRSHAIRLAEEGADIIAVDILQDYETVSYGMGTQQDLAETVTAVTALGRKIIARKADVRDDGQRACQAQHQGQHRPPDRREHPDGHRPRRLYSLLARDPNLGPTAPTDSGA